MKEKRLNRINEFEKFYDNCKNIFNKLANKDDRIDFF